jgi:dihydroorotate dehydrogenase (NAD+) catalytic subunit
VGSIELPSPIMTAAGTAGHGAELHAFFDLSELGAVVVKSLAPYPWAGNPPLRVHASQGGMLNSVGLQGPGLPVWLSRELPALEQTGARIVASIWGRSVEDYQRGAELLAAAGPQVVAVEVNISCPNTEAGNELFAHSPELTERVLAATAACGRPRWAKLSPNVGFRLPEIAAAAAAGGAEAVTLVNTYFALSIDVTTGRPRLGAGRGGLSGPAIHPMAVRAVADVRAALPDLPIVAVGGAATVDDVVEFALVGAQAVQIGTATLADPRACHRLGIELGHWCANQGVENFVDLIGTVQLGP